MCQTRRVDVLPRVVIDEQVIDKRYRAVAHYGLQRALTQCSHRQLR